MAAAPAPLSPPRSAGDTLVVAGIDVRALAESAQAGGWRVIALDLFGDRDTRRASVRWAAIGEASALRLDAGALAAELRAAARERRVAGWVPGSGFEGALALLELGGDLPCLATSAVQQRRLRAPREFFAALDRHGLAHPEVALRRPVAGAGAGWLAKRAGGCGGGHVRAAESVTVDAADTYWQRLQAGTPMSALFLADGARAVVVGLNRQLVEPRPGKPFVYAGAIGPIEDPALERAIDHALHLLVPEFGLRGLASLDFVTAGGTPWLLEINARPSASMQLHDDAWPRGLMHAHVQAVRGLLPDTPPRRAPLRLRGHRIVYATRPGMLEAGHAAAFAADPALHDLPAAGARFAAGEPICSVGARAASEDALRHELQRLANAVRERLTLVEECPT